MGTEEAHRQFRDVFWPQLPVVLRTAQILCGGDVPDAEDLAQETMIKAFRAMDRFEPGTDARKWLLAILRNARIDRLRSKAGSEHLVSLDALPQEPEDRRPAAENDESFHTNPQEVLESFSDRQMIEAMQGLPEEIRWTLLLVDVQGLDHRVAAEVLEVPVGTIKSRASRGRALLRRALLPIARERRVVRD